MYLLDSGKGGRSGQVLQFCPSDVVHMVKRHHSSEVGLFIKKKNTVQHVEYVLRMTGDINCVNIHLHDSFKHKL